MNVFQSCSGSTISAGTERDTIDILGFILLAIYPNSTIWFLKSMNLSVRFTASKVMLTGYCKVSLWMSKTGIYCYGSMNV